MSRFHLSRGCIRAAFLLALAAPASAQQELTLHEAQRLALGRSQQLVSRDAAAASARELGVAAGRLPDPVLKLGISNLPIDGPDRFSLTRDFMTMRNIGVAQELTRADKRRLGVERMNRDVERAEAEKLAAAAEVQRNTALAWIDRRYAEAIADLIRRQVQAAELEVQGAEIAYRNGRASQADFFGSRAAVANLRDKLRESERQVRSATLALGRWVGPGEAGRPLAGVVPWRESEVAGSLLPERLEQLPQLAAQRARIAAAETEVRQAQANTRPDWTLEATYSQRGPAYSNMVSIGLSVPLQVDRAGRQDREVAAKVAALGEARADYEEALRTLDAELGALLDDWNTGKERVGRLQAELVPAARLRTQGALTAYETGKGELTAVLGARREEIEAGLQVLTLERETARLWAQLNFLVPDLAALAVAKEQP